VSLLHGDKTQQCSKITEEAIKQVRKYTLKFQGLWQKWNFKFQQITVTAALLIIFQSKANYIKQPIDSDRISVLLTIQDTDTILLRSVTVLTYEEFCVA